MFRGTWIHNIIDIAFPFKWKNSLKVPEKKKKGNIFCLLFFTFHPNKDFWLSMSRYFHCILTVAPRLKYALHYLTLLLKRHWKRPTEWQHNCMYELKQNILYFAFFARKVIFLFPTTKYWILYNSWNEYQRKTRVKCQKRRVKHLANELLYSHWGQEHLLPSK